jgi:membrane-associated phospholipid phosphatase
MTKRTLQIIFLSLLFLAATAVYSFAGLSPTYRLPAPQLKSDLFDPPLSHPAFDTPSTIEGAAAAPARLDSYREIDLLPGGVTGNPVLLAEAQAAERESAKEWRWRKAGVPEYVAVSIAAVGTAFFETQNREPDEAKWRHTNGFDETMRDIFRLESRTARDATQNASEFLMGIMIAAPFLETFSTLGVRDSSWSTQWQTQMVNVESFTFTSLVSSVLQNLFTRERPFVRNCENGDCEGYLKNRSMPSGHMAFALTGAGLICTHQKYQEIYDPETERSVCATGVGIAVVDGVLRIISDRHYTTDVLVGAAIGYFSGFILPRWLHYDHPQEPEAPKSATRPPLQLIGLTPELLHDGATLSCQFGF